MEFKDTYPDYVPIEEHIRRARIERSLALANLIADGITSVARGFGWIGASLVRAKKAPALTLPREAAHR